MTTLKALRGDLAGVLANTGLTVKDHLPERVNPPLALIGAGSPYVESGDTYGTFAVRFTIFLIAARAANETATDQLDELILTALDAVMDTAGWGVERVDQPQMVEANGAQFLGTTLEVITRKPLGGG